jgi:hypothetical protein
MFRKDLQQASAANLNPFKQLLAHVAMPVDGKEVVQIAGVAGRFKVYA